MAKQKTPKVKAEKEVIKAGTIARVTDKVSGKFLGFLVKSNFTQHYYEVTCLKIAGECVFFCTCEAKEWGCAECNHVKAVKLLCIARKALRKRAEQGVVAANIAVFCDAAAQFALDSFSANIALFCEAVAEIAEQEAWSPPADQAPKFALANAPKAPVWPTSEQRHNATLNNRPFSLLK